MDSSKLYKYDEATATIGNLNSTWEPRIKEAEKRRKIRNHDVDVDALRNAKPPNLLPHETYIPVRIADTNINREKANWIAYIVQSPRAGVFQCISGKSVVTQPLEAEFTTFARYEGYEAPFFRWCDGCLTHGLDYVETIFDPSKPGHFANVHIGFGRCRYAEDTEDLQKAPCLLVDCVYSAEELDAFVENREWSASAVKLVKDSQATREEAEGSFVITKFLFKDDGVVQIGYWHEKANDWLCAPKKLYLGKVNDDGTPTEETEYPIEPLPYVVSENSRLVDCKGRVFLDMHVQEAATRGASAYINGLTLASRMIGSPKNPTDSTTAKQTDTVIETGRVWDSPMEFYHVEPPPAECIRGVDWLINQNSNETSQVNYAAMNRTDSRKTATEISSANQQASMLNSEKVAVLGLAMRNVLRRCWEICRSQVLQGKIQSACREKYNEQYVILPAGDADVIRRQEKQLKMRQDWPVVAAMSQQLGVPELATEFLVKIFRETYPEDGEGWANILKKGDQKTQMLMAVPQLLRGLAQQDPNVGAALAPHAKMLEQFEQQVASVLNPEQAQAQPAQQQAA